MGADHNIFSLLYTLYGCKITTHFKMDFCIIRISTETIILTMRTKRDVNKSLGLFQMSAFLNKNVFPKRGNRIVFEMCDG